jgi:hypothetical protein
LPIIHKNAKNPAVSRRLVLLTFILCGIGVGVLVLQQYISFFWE